MSASFKDNYRIVSDEKIHIQFGGLYLCIDTDCL